MIEIITPLLSGVKKRNSYYMGVSKNSGTPKWMVYSGKPIKMDLGVRIVFGNTHIYKASYRDFTCAGVDQLLLFHSGRGWSSTQFNRG